MSKNTFSVTKFKVFIGIIILAFILLIVAFCNTASFKRGLVDIKSDWTGGLDREVNVLNANGDVIRHFEGKIDIEADGSGGEVKFDFNGKRYIYYNCYVETIGDL